MCRPFERGGWSKRRRYAPFVDTINDVDRVFEYEVFSGKRTASVFSEMLQHVVNHASYHRGQVTLMLRQLQAAPPRSQDLISFYRERDE